MPRREPRRNETVPETFFSVLICCVLPLGILGVLVAATIQNFEDQSQAGWCRATPATLANARCDPRRGSGRQIEYVAMLQELVFALDVNATAHAICSLQRTFETEQQCEDELKIWHVDQAEQCFRSTEDSWWLDKPDEADRCVLDPPQNVDSFDKALPIVCAVVLVTAVLFYWGLRLQRWCQRRANGTLGESTPLMERGSVPVVVRHGTVDDGLVTVSAEWTSASDAAIIVGDASKGQFPCDVQKVYDVGTTLQPECTVCLENEKSVVMWPCRHLCVCPECAIKLRKCPVCRSRVKKRLCLELRQLGDGFPGDDSSDGGDDEDDKEGEVEPEVPTRRATVRLSLSPLAPPPPVYSDRSVEYSDRGLDVV